ncbi:MAG TPA: STAS domain-containing protein [Thermoanaerobaculia bacterium]|nr:STAS domain-containing protein [Thermoanaerobaculia bacterium]
MEIAFRESGAVTVVAIRGSVDGLTAGDLSDAVAGRVKEGRTRLVADFAEVEYISSAGLRALLGALKDARQQGGDFRLAAIRPDVQRVLDLSGFTSILKAFATVDAAVGSFGA